MRPTPFLVRLALGGVPLAALPALIGDRFAIVWLAYVAALLASAGLDALLGLSRRRLTVTPSITPTIPLGDAGALSVLLESRGGSAAWVEAIADLDPELSAQPPQRVTLAAGGEATLEVPLVPKRRGSLEVRAVHLRWAGPLGLVSRQMTTPVGKRAAVIPDLRPVRRAALLFSTRESMVGSKRERHRGEGSEFESLREHVAGLDPRTIDWKASARHRRLLSREHRAERDHQVIFAIDTGRLMREPLEGIPRLDHAIHAALLLAYLALRTGDRVGLAAFDERPTIAASPVSGPDAFARIQSAAAGLAYSTAETNFTLGLLDLNTRLKRRSLVIVFTEFVDVVSAELMLDNVARLARRHLVLFVALRDPTISALVEAPPSSSTALYRAVTAAEFARDRDVVLRRLRRMGVQVVDAEPSQVSTDLVNQYLDIQRRELVG